MNISKSVKKFSLSSVVLAAMLVSVSASAVRLPSDTLLSIDAGVVSPTACTSGSCFSMEVVPGFTVWKALEAGTDGGIILGKDQTTGGQQIGTDSMTNSTPGQAVNAFYFFSNYGSMGTAPMSGTVSGVITNGSSLNFFDAASCVGAACNNVTKLGTWNVAWSGLAAPMGSEGGCLSVNCTADQLSGIFVSKWNVTGANGETTYILDYSQVVPDGHPSGFGGQPFAMHLVGRITLPPGTNVPPTANNVAIGGTAGAVLTWTPSVSDADSGPNPLTCFIGTPPANGTATVAANCSSGSYVSNGTFSGTDSFTYVANDGLASSNVATVTATISAQSACVLKYPSKTVTTSKSNMKIVSTGNIVRVDDHIHICSGTLLSYSSTSSTYPGKVTCKINGTSAPVTGKAKIDDTLKCTLKPYRDQSITVYVRKG